MGGHSKIEWTDATWTPIRARNRATGKVGWHCTHVSPGCEHCYAESINRRLGTGLPFKPGHEKDVDLFLDERMLAAPLRWRKPRMVFVCSMTDLFHESVPDAWIDRVFAVMALAPQHTFQALTKRSARMRAYLSAWPMRSDQPDRITDIACEIGHATRGYRGSCGLAERPLPNVWLGVSVEDQARAEERVPDLLATPAAVRFVSAEPLLAPVDLSRFHIGWSRCSVCGEAYDPSPEYPLGTRNECPDCFCELEVAGHHLHWVICGGESGPGARPMHPDWARSLRDQCAAAEVPFFFKQWGEWAPSHDVPIEVVGMRDQATVLPDGRVREWQPDFPEARLTDPGMRPMTRVGKRAAGRLLDGVAHDALPRVGCRMTDDGCQAVSA